MNCYSAISDVYSIYNDEALCDQLLEKLGGGFPIITVTLNKEICPMEDQPEVITSSNTPKDSETLIILEKYGCEHCQLESETMVNVIVINSNLQQLTINLQRINYINTGYSANLELLNLSCEPAKCHEVITNELTKIEYNYMNTDKYIKQLTFFHPFLCGNEQFQEIKQQILQRKDIIFAILNTTIKMLYEDGKFLINLQDFEEYEPSFGLDNLQLAGSTLFIQYYQKCKFIEVCNSDVAKLIINAPYCYDNVYLCKNRVQYLDISECIELERLTAEKEANLKVDELFCQKNIEVLPKNLFLDEFCSTQYLQTLLKWKPFLRFNSEFLELNKYIAAKKNCIFILQEMNIIKILVDKKWFVQVEDYDEFEPNFAIDNCDYNDGILFCEYTDPCEWIEFNNCGLERAIINAPYCTENICMVNNKLQYLNCENCEKIAYVNIKNNKDAVVKCSGACSVVK